MQRTLSSPGITNYISPRLHTLLRSCSSITYKRRIATVRSNPSKHTQLPDKPARTRFAPSPTGYLHLGSLRTALYNYLLARATNGQFVLRLEDTDQSRLVPDAEKRLYEDLKWSGLSWDEGPDLDGPFGPYKQSMRLPIYHDHANYLLEKGKAFRCFCSHHDIATHNRKSLSEDGTFGRYPGLCLSISPDEASERAFNGEAHTVRFKSSGNPPAVRDIVYGLHEKKLQEDHFIIIKSDGFPTYHFANVVDDHLMKITHVIRGAEWLISTAKHVSLYDAFGWQLPEFAHVGLLVDARRQKLSKRNLDIGISSYRGDCVPPQALLNFVALLGWNPGVLKNKGVMTLDEMVENFSLKFTKGDIVVNLEKLAFFQKKHIRLAIDALPSDCHMADEILVDPMLQIAQEIEAQRQWYLAHPEQEGTEAGGRFALLGSPFVSLRETDRTAARQQVHTILKISRNECLSAREAVEANKFLLWRPSATHIRRSYPPIGEAFLNGRAADFPPKALRRFIDAMRKIKEPSWTHDEVQSALRETVDLASFHEGQQIPTATIFKYLRWALLGLTHGPQIAPLLEFLGRDETLRRLQFAESVAQSSSTRSTP